MAHMIEDLVWKSPKLFFWPYYNWIVANIKGSQPTIGGVDINKRIEIITESVTKLDMKKILLEPDVLIPEILGGFIILYFFFKLMRNKSLIRFFKTGSREKL
jgi:hypothetical protein